MTPRRILVVKLSSFGDIIHATSSLHALRDCFPQAEIVLAVESRWRDVVRCDPHVDALVESSSRTRLTLSYLNEIRRKLSVARRAGDFDLAIDLQGTWRSAAWVYLSGARVRLGRGGMRPGWRATCAADRRRHAVLLCVEACEKAGVAVSQPAPKIYTDAAEEARVDDMLVRSGVGKAGFVLLNPFSRWDSKSWAVAKAAALAARIRRDCNLPVVVSGGAEEQAKATALLDLSRDAGVVSMAGELSLAQAMCLYRRGRLMISCDSGPMHAAAALGVPVLALFGPTHPEHSGPWGHQHKVLQALRPASHHAYRNDPQARFMQALEVEPVFDAVREMLA